MHAAMSTTQADAVPAKGGSGKLSKVARLRKRFSESLGRLACKFTLNKIPDLMFIDAHFFDETALAKEDWSVSRTRSQSRLAAYKSSKERSRVFRVNGKGGFTSDEFLDKLDSGGSETGESGGEPELRWERLRLSDGDLLTASRDPEFEKLKVSTILYNLKYALKYITQLSIHIYKYLNAKNNFKI